MKICIKCIACNGENQALFLKLERNLNTYLSRCATQFLQTILQADNLGLKFCVVLAKQVLIQLNLLQETLWCCVVVPLLVRQVGVTDFVDRCVYVGHELGNGVT